MIVAYGAYSGRNNEELVAEKNMKLVTIKLTRHKAENIATDFEFNEEGTRMKKCAGEFEPKSCNYKPYTGQCTDSLYCSQCE